MRSFKRDIYELTALLVWSGKHCSCPKTSSLSQLDFSGNEAVQTPLCSSRGEEKPHNCEDQACGSSRRFERGHGMKRIIGSSMSRLVFVDDLTSLLLGTIVLLPSV
jgi:hypothetical protein